MAVTEWILSRPSVEGVLRLAILSRLLLLSLVLLWRYLCDPYDTSALISPPCLAGSPAPEAARWPRLAAAIERGVVWDSVYFVRIAECGYEYEQAYAFFPLLPATMFLLSRSVFAPLVPFLGYRAVLAVSGYFISNVAFVFAAAYFYRLSDLILKNSKVAMSASLLFCFNPASIFYSSIYSESLYALCSLGGQFYTFCGATTKAMILFAMSCTARSNGAVNAGYLLFQAFLVAFEVISRRKLKLVAVQAIFVGAVRSIIVFLPYITFQVFGYLRICLGGDSDNLQPWCHAKIPHLYSYIQNRYWGVGFLNYFQVKQVPNFILASPMLSLAVYSIIYYASAIPKIAWSLNRRVGKDATLSWYSRKTHEHPEDTSTSNLEGSTLVKRKRKKDHDVCETFLGSEAVDEADGGGYHSVFVLPFILHLGFLTLTAFFVMHVQVATRFLSASPPVYWFASYVLFSTETGTTSTRMGYLIMVYFASYILLGSLLFSNFYPFT